jgi:hypothetical protein
MCIIKFIKKLFKCDCVSVLEFEKGNNTISAALNDLNSRLIEVENKIK